MVLAPVLIASLVSAASPSLPDAELLAQAERLSPRGCGCGFSPRWPGRCSALPPKRTANSANAGLTTPTSTATRATPGCWPTTCRAHPRLSLRPASRPFQRRPARKSDLCPRAGARCFLRQLRPAAVGGSAAVAAASGAVGVVFRPAAAHLRSVLGMSDVLVDDTPRASAVLGPGRIRRGGGGGAAAGGWLVLREAHRGGVGGGGRKRWRGVAARQQHGVSAAL